MVLQDLITHFIAWASLVTIIITILSILIYRRGVHPLGKFPGPWLNSVSAIPSAVQHFRGLQHTYHQKLHDKYGIETAFHCGPIVRVAPNEIIFTDADAWEEIYGYRHGDVMEKGPIFIGIASPLNGYVGIGLARGREHARQRRAVAVGFTKKALLTQGEVMQSHVDKLITTIRTRSIGGKAINMAQWYAYITFDIIGDLCFGEPFGCMDLGEATEWALATSNVLVSATWDQGIRKVFGVNTLLHRMVLWFMPSKVTKTRNLHVSKSFDKTQKRLANETSSRPDLVYHIQQNSDVRKSLAPTELGLNMTLLLSAGSETTAILLTTLTYALCTNSTAYNRLATAIRTRFPDRNDLALDQLQEIPYLEACIKETLRLFPPAAANLMREVPLNGAQVRGHQLPSGCLVSVSQWASTRSTRQFHLPNEFHPERWLRENPEEGWDPIFEHDVLNASRPFGAGPKACLGQNLTLFETRLIVAQLLLAFDFELEDAGMQGVQNRTWTMSPRDSNLKVYQALSRPDLWIRFTERRSGDKNERLND